MNALATLWFSLKIVVVLLTKSCPTLWNSLDCSRPDSSVHRILQARILEWVAIPSSRGSSWPRDWTHISCTAGRFFTIWVTREALLKIGQPLKIALVRNSKSEAPTALVLIINLPTYKPTQLPNHLLLAQYANEKNIGKASLYRNHKPHLCYEELLQSLRRLCSLFNWTSGPWRLVPGCCFITPAWGGTRPGRDHHPRVRACLGQLEGRGHWLTSAMSQGAS